MGKSHVKPLYSTDKEEFANDKHNEFGIKNEFFLEIAEIVLANPTIK